METYFNHADALRFIDECEENGVRIPGWTF